MMEFYMKKAAQEEKRGNNQGNQKMKCLHLLLFKLFMSANLGIAASSKKGHHYIPPEELEKFMSSCTKSNEREVEVAERAKIQADNVGHKLLSKMGWREGEGLGSSRQIQLWQET